MKHTVLFILICLGCTFLISCDKDPEIIIQKETITVHDTLVVVDTFTIVETVFQTLPDTATTFILVRHAETTGTGSNPNLSATGQARAAALSKLLGPLTINAIYSTNYNRTMQTAQVVATAKGLPVLNYDPFQPEPLIDQSLANFPKGIVLIVGHTNTIPDFINTMTGSAQFPVIPETEYDNLYIVHVSERGDATVVHLKYGE